MTNHDDQDKHGDWQPKVRLGDPNNPEAPFDSPSIQPSRQNLGDGVRQAGSLGVPDQAAEEATVVTPRDSLLEKRAAEWDLDEAGQADSGLSDGSAWLPSRTVSFSLLAIVSSLIFLFLAAQLVTLFAQLAMLPNWARFIGFGVVVAFLLALLFGLIRLVLLYLRLRATPRLSLLALRQLHGRQKLRRLARRRIGEVRRDLRLLLEEYPATGDSNAGRLRKLGFTASDITTLREHRRRLLDDRRSTAEGWVEHFDRQFLSCLDGACEQRIRLYTKRVALQTGISKLGRFDALVVTLNAYRMVADLCQIYNLRANPWGTVRIMAWVFFQAYAASRLDDWSDSAVDEVKGILGNHLPHMAQSLAEVGTGAAVAGGAMAATGVGAVPGAIAAAGGMLAANVASKLVARAADGLINACLIYRLGKAAMRELRPLT